MLRTPLSRRATLRRLAALSAAGPLLAASAASANTYPNQPIRLVVGYPPGGSNDIVARIIAPHLGQELNATIVVENKAGASGAIGAEHVARSQPDGYTLLFSSMSPVVLTPQTMEKLPFHTPRDFAPINIVGLTPEVIGLGPALGNINTLSALFEYAKTREVTLSSSGPGGLPHLTIELLAKASGGKIVHVPYRGGGPALTDTLAGHVDGIVMDLAPLYAQIRDGHLKALAVTSGNRVDFLPNIPTAQEELPGFNVVNWLGVFAPAGTPDSIIQRLDGALRKVVAVPAVRQQLVDVAVVPDVMANPRAFQERVNEDYTRWGSLIREVGVTMHR